MLAPIDRGAVLDVNPELAAAVARGLRERSKHVVKRGQDCDRIEVMGEFGAAHEQIGTALGGFTWMWGSAVSALGQELDLLGFELGRASGAVMEVDLAGIV